MEAEEHIISQSVPKEKRVSIAYIPFCIFSSKNDTPYHDIDRVVSEAAERGFNAIRLDCGTGMIDFSGKEPNGLIQMTESVPGHDQCIRQVGACLGGVGECDILQRLLAFLQCGKKYGVKLILSSWYYMHTFWWFGNAERNRFLHELPAHEKIQYFASELNKLLAVIRSHGLLDVIEYSDIINEFDCRFSLDLDSTEWDTPDKRRLFQRDHEQALAFLERENPDVRFGVNTYRARTWSTDDFFPRNAKIWDCHNYFLWFPLYNGLMNYSNEEEAQKWFKPSPESWECIRSIPASCNKYPFEDSSLRWFWFFNNLDYSHIPELEAILEKRLRENKNLFIDKFEETLAYILEFHRKNCPDAELYSTEGVSFSPCTDFIFEEKSDLFWEIVEYVVRRYRDSGLRGCVLRTNCGPEDPSWNMRKKDIIHINKMFHE